MLEMLALLLVSHAVCDYPLQGDFLARFKNPAVGPLPTGETIWFHALTAHALIHAGGVFVVTQSLWAFAFELVAHWLIDLAKCRGWLNFHGDQAMHVLCKVIIVAALSF
jgi:hypothetical protein